MTPPFRFGTAPPGVSCGNASKQAACVEGLEVEMNSFEVSGILSCGGGCDGGGILVGLVVPFGRGSRGWRGGGAHGSWEARRLLQVTADHKQRNMKV